MQTREVSLDGIEPGVRASLALPGTYVTGLPSAGMSAVEQCALMTACQFRRCFFETSPARPCGADAPMPAQSMICESEVLMAGACMSRADG